MFLFFFADLGMMNREREAKIQRYKEKKMLEGKLKELKAAVDHPSCDDDVARDFYLSTIKKFVLTSLDELESIKQESEILRHMASMPKRGAEAPKRQPSRSGQIFFLSFMQSISLWSTINHAF